MVARDIGRCTVIFEGRVYNRRDIARSLDALQEPIDDADLLLRAYRRWGIDLARRINGAYAVVVIDQDERRVIAVRDPLGAYPLFYARAQGSINISMSIEALLARPSIGRTLSRAALVDHLCHNWTDPHETFFEGIRRLPRGHQLVADSQGLVVTRYWQPVESNKPVPWIPESDVQEQFDDAFEQAVERTLTQGPTGIFLSGGLDSISVAAVATDIARRKGHPIPRPFSLGFPGDADEAVEQRGVAGALGMEHEFVPYADAVPKKGLLASALEITQQQAAPLLNTWMPAYTDLTYRAKRRGLTAILSGAGGDEWLSVSPTLAADMIRRGDLKGLWKLTTGWQHSYNLSLPRTLHMLFWKYGMSPVLAGVADRTAPRAYRASRVRRSMSQLGHWAAPDPVLRNQVTERIGRWLPVANPSNGLYLRDTINMMEHPLAAMEAEETFEMGRRLDMRYLQPYWDPNVADILYRTPPLLLFASGRSKSVVRRAMAHRFPGLGLERQKKRAGTTFMASVLMSELPPLWQRAGDLTALSDLRVIEPTATSRLVAECLASGSPTRNSRVWEMMNVETWVRAHQ
jgi:asparagine synthase (glutamine-hydrolysing)